MWKKERRAKNPPPGMDDPGARGWMPGCVLVPMFAIPLFLWRSVSAAEPASQLSMAEMDKMSGVKGWNIGFPSFGDTLAQDYGGWRSSLASAGIGLIEYNSERFQANLLDTPRESLRINPFY